MTDARKFCWGTFIGMAGGATLQNHGLMVLRADVDSAGALLVLGLMTGCLAIMTFGSRVEGSDDRTP